MNGKKKLKVLGAGWIGIPLAESLSKKFSCQLLKQAQITNTSIETDDIVIATWPAKAQAAFETLSPEQTLFAMSSTSGSNEILQFEDFLKKRFKKLCLLRLGGLIGYDRHPGKFFSGKQNIPGKDHPVNLIHRDDVIQIIHQLLDLKQFPEGDFDVVSDHHPSKVKFYRTAAEALNLPLPHFNPDDSSTKAAVSNQKLKQLLNYHFLYPSPEDYLQVLRERQSQRT